ncbi:MAG: type II secretion system protein [Opitutales bacterium]
MKHHTPSAFKMARARLNLPAQVRSNNRVQRRPAFTLVEIMIVVVIIGLLAAIAIPTFQQIRRESRAATFVADLRVFRDALDVYLTGAEDYPVDSGSGNFPPELAGFVNSDLWTRETPIGGDWDLEVLDTGITVAVGVHNFGPDTEMMQIVDDKMDDGNLNTGRLRLIDTDRYYWVIEE